MADHRYIDGSIQQSAHTWEKPEYDNDRMYFPMLGVVLEVFPPDHPDNRSSVSDDRQRGFYWEAKVLILNDGKDGAMILPHVAIIPKGPTGIDDFTQEVPRGSSQLTDGSVYRSSTANIDPSKLDGDRCLVEFLGGRVTQPIMTSWMPHPANTVDPSTAGFTDDTLSQGTPSIYRRKGVTLVIDDSGNTSINTTAGGSKVAGSAAGIVRSTEPLGGELQVDMKEFSKFEINFNPPVNAFEDNPSSPQPNPALVLASKFERTEDRSSYFMDKDLIIAIAKEVAKIISNSGHITLQPATSLYFGDELSDENMVLGRQWKSMMTILMDAFLNHTHSTGTGPSGPPLPPQNSQVQDLIDTIDDVLSDYIFGSKEAPDPNVATDKDDAVFDEDPPDLDPV